ncbi:HVA22 domain containing membrane protein [Coccidioides immitis RMSCC 3703]|uniref:Protein YOP1 n=2 Tax=Coccidioides TaxID=5500 RepID=A0A0J8R0Q1_COCIT|nr:HVA22 domain containing membrane protein [Coccidioides immitis RMSCC 3703]
MFGIIADLLSSVLTVLFPIFASYKALRTSDVSQIAPWLMYWVVLSIVLLVESWTFFIVGWFPFYSWIRLFALSYLVLPQTQGAKKLYLERVDPFLHQYERQIEEFIGETHERAKEAGLNYLYQAIDLIREKVLGLPPVLAAEAAPPPPASGPASYAQTLFSRFNLPAGTGTNLAGPASDLFSMLGSAVTAVTSTGKNRDTQAEELSATGLLPHNLASASKNEQASYISSQKEKLRILLSALDREHRNLGLEGREEDDLAYGTSYDSDSRGLKKNQSENSFENIDHEELGASSAFYKDGSGRRRPGRHE